MELELVLLAAIVALANTVEAVTGFGASIVALTLGALLRPVPELIPILIPLNLGLSAAIVLRGRRVIDRPLLLRTIVPHAGLGLVAGFALFVGVGDEPALVLAYGGFVVVLAVSRLWALLREGEGAAATSSTRSPLWLVAGGVMQGLFTAGGPLVILYTSAALPDKTAFRATMSGLWLILNLALVVGFTIHGDLDAATLRETATMVPSLLVGLVLGEWLHHRVSPRGFRGLVFGLLLIAGGILVGRGLLA
ncbi:MAG: sulfite exporter TauE/SafE family protein [Nannocystaceae bacterium]